MQVVLCVEYDAQCVELQTVSHLIYVLLTGNGVIVHGKLCIFNC